MIQSRFINIIVVLVVLVALVVGGAFLVLSNKQQENGSLKSVPEYAAKIFGSDIISIEIIADEADWQEMLDKAMSEQYIMADVIVNGTKFQNVGIRPKGNSSLTQVAGSDSERYSFRLQFDEYIKGQTCFGLESFVVNNMLGDNTYMKEYVSYELMREIGVDTPYFGYANIKVNDENWGLYLAVELYNDSYEQRVFGDTAGMLYNVKSMEMGGNMGGNKDGKQEGNRPEGLREPMMPSGENSRPPRPDFAPGQNFEMPDLPIDSEEGKDKIMFPTPMDSEAGEEMEGFGGMGRPGSSGGSLEYIDDNTASYTAIFNNVIGKGTEQDFKRVVQALKALSTGEEMETFFDIDQILRYLAAHTMVVNLDSYSSNMAQNYYIYERKGQLTILPWDYNLAWGGFQNGDVSAVINFPIDTPLSNVEMSKRPLIDKLFANSEYLARYHLYLQELVDNYFDQGKFEEKVKELDALISDYVENDSTAFCSYEEYKRAVATFITLGELRGQSVQGQLDGTIPATTAEQKVHKDKLITSDIKLSDLGSMMGGKGGNNGEVRRMEGNRGLPNLANMRLPSNPEITTNKLFPLAGLLLLLITGLLFAIRIKKTY